MQSIFHTSRNSHQRCSVRKDILRNFAKFTEKRLWQSLFFNKVAGLLQLYWKQTPTQVFSCEYCEIFKKSYFKATSANGCFWKTARLRSGNTFFTIYVNPFHAKAPFLFPLWTFGFLPFSGGIKMEYWREID